MNLPPPKACRGCGLLVHWVTLASGKRMQLNSIGDSRAGRVFFHAGKWQVASRTVQPPPATTLYVPHFATCPNASQFRGKGRK